MSTATRTVLLVVIGGAAAVGAGIGPLWVVPLIWLGLVALYEVQGGRGVDFAVYSAIALAVLVGLNVAS